MTECEKVRTVAYVVGNPWPICYDCRRHVYMIEATGEWRHFPGSAPKPHAKGQEADRALRDGHHEPAFADSAPSAAQGYIGPFTSPQPKETR